MTDVVKPKKERVTKTVSKISLTEKASEKIEKWLVQVNASLYGAKLNRSELASWYLAQASDNLTEAQIEALKIAFQSEVGFAQWLAKEIARRHAAGDLVSVEELVKTKLALAYKAQGSPRKRQKREKNNSSTSLNSESDTKIERPVTNDSNGGPSSVSEGEK